MPQTSVLKMLESLKAQKVQVVNQKTYTKIQVEFWNLSSAVKVSCSVAHLHSHYPKCLLVIIQAGKTILLDLWASHTTSFLPILHFLNLICPKLPCYLSIFSRKISIYTMPCRSLLNKNTLFKRYTEKKRPTLPQFSNSQPHEFFHTLHSTAILQVLTEEMRNLNLFQYKRTALTHSFRIIWPTQKMGRCLERAAHLRPLK